MNTSKTWIWILIAVVVLALFLTARQYGFFSRPVVQEEASLLDNDTIAEIDRDLNAVDVGNPDQDLRNLDSDLNRL